MKKIIPILFTLFFAFSISANAQTKLGASNTKVKTGVNKGQMAPDFTLTTPEGKKLSLSSLRGKYVVIDFWGSWCYWCMQGMPELKKYYKKYAGKLEILGVNVGDSQTKWKNTIKSSGLTWKHVRCDENASSKIESSYRLEGFPTKLLISPEGKVIAYVCGEDPEFYQMIENALSGK